jgi:hypothetical protein
MYKSALTFGLLASSLMMLAVMPFLNNNSFSTVLTQEYDKFGDSSYSQYPTDDKKYECRTGPFEGFFVSSVEFCKFNKFDDSKRDNNQTGTQGPQGQAGGQPGPEGPPGPVGPQGERGLTGATGATGPASTVPGPQGIQGLRGFNGTNGVDGTNGTIGPQGPAGLNQINSTNIYLKLGNQINSNLGTTPSEKVISNATCDSGDIVIEGGYEMLPFSDNSVPPFLIINGPTPTPSNPTLTEEDQGYLIMAYGGGARIQAYAFCFDNPPLRP